MFYLYLRYWLLMGIALVSCLLARPILAQTNWVAGYVVPIFGDTLRGQLDDRDWQRTPETVRFRPQAQAPEVTYSVREIQAFGLSEARQHFVRWVGSLHRPPKIGELPTKPQPNWVFDTVFVRVLRQGPLSLATHRDEHAFHYLIRADTASTWTELLLLRYLDTDNQVREMERYKQQLYLALTPCPPVQAMATRAQLQENSLRNLVDAYNTCQGKQETLPTAAAPGKALEWGLLAGMSLTRMNFRSDNYVSTFQYTGSDTFHYGAGVSPTVGVWGAFNISRRRPQWAVYADLRYQGYAAKSSTELASSWQGALTYRYAKLYTGMRWRYPGKGVSIPYVLVGVSNGFVLTKKQTVTFNGTRNHEQGLFAGFGVRNGRLGGEVRYELGNGTSDGYYIRTLTSTWIAQLVLTL